MTGGRRRPLSSRAVLLLAAAALLASACSEEPVTPAPATRTTAATPPPHRLAAGDRVERELRAGEAHLYVVEPPADGWFRVRAVQLGVDLALRLAGPDGAERVADRPTGARGAEELLVVGPGVHRLTVQPWDQDESEGTRLGMYELVATAGVVDETTPARLAAERACESALASYFTGGEAERRRVVEGLETCAAGLAAIGDELREAQALFDLGRAFEGWGGLPAERRVEAFERAAELFGRAGEPGAERWARCWLGLALDAAGRRRQAIEVLEELAPRLDESEHGEILVVTLGRLGALYSRTGAWDEALSVLLRARSLAVEPTCDQMNRLAQWGVLLRRIGAYDDARPPLDEAIRLGEELQCRPSERAVAVYRRGEIALADADLEAAADYAAKAVRLGGEEQRASSRLFQGNVALARGDLDLAAEALGEARRLYEQHGRTRNVAICDLSLGELALARGESAVARETFRRVLSMAEANGEPATASSALQGIARSHLEAGELHQARRTVERALEVVEGMRRVPSSRTLKAKLLASQRSRFDLHVEVLMRLHEAHPGDGWDAQAVHACERARARSLLDTLSGELGEPSDRARQLQAQIAEIEDRLFWDGEEAAEAQRRKLEDLELELEQERTPTLPRERVLSAAEIQRTLDDGSLVLSFHLGAERSFLWVVGRRRIDSYALVGRAEIETLARRAHESVFHTYSNRAHRRRQAQRALEALSQALLAPAAERLGGAERLLIVAEGQLHYVPFAALPMPASGRTLTEDHEMVVLPSASALAEQRRRLAGRPAAGGSLVAVADPVFGPDDERLSERPAAAQSRRRSGETLRRLPHTATEVDRIVELVPGGEPSVLRGFEATAQAVRDGGLHGFRYVHLATHTVLSGDDPRLVFSLYDADGSVVSRGSLHSRDVYDLDLPAELVVLSACSTGLGEEIDGEGLVGFTQGFFFAGARRVMVSLWDVSDESTAVLMQHFYEGLFVRGLSPAAALRRAQRTMAHDERFAAPFHWAGFQLLGEPR